MMRKPLSELRLIVACKMELDVQFAVQWHPKGRDNGLTRGRQNLSGGNSQSLGSNRVT